MQKAEQLSGDNQFECSNCKRKSDATREFRIKKLPPYLCLPIGRLYYDSKVGSISAKQKSVARHYSTSQGK